MGLLNKKKEEKFKEVEQPEHPETEENPMEEIAEETRKGTEEKKRIVVVKELPTQQVRQAKAEDGVIEIYVTVEEALSNIMNAKEEE